MDPYSPLADVLRSQHDHVKIAVDVEVTALDGVAPAADTADASSWILAVVANVDKGFEETALLVLKRRRKDQSKAKVVDALPVLKDFRCSIAQAALDDDKENSSAGGAAIEDVGMSPALSELGTSSRLRLTLLLGGKAVVASSEDAQNVKDLLSVLRASVQVAEDHSDQLSHDWLRHYVDDYKPNSTDGAASAPIFSRFTQSALFPTPPSSSSLPASPASAGPRQRAPSPAADEVKITIGTFNVNGQAPTAATPLGAWLHPEDEPDILVVSLQEADASSLSYVYWTPHVQEAWDGAVRSVLARRAGEYEKVAARQLVGILLFVYVRRELLPRLSHVALTSLGVGLGGWAANKGAVAARFEVDGTSMCFVASHLSAFEGGEARERRRWDYGEIVRRLSFTYALDDDDGGGESDENGKAHQAAEDPASIKEQVAKKHVGRERNALDLTMAEPDAATLLQAQLQASLDAEAAAAAAAAAADPVSYEEATVFDHDVVFWAGDLNFRLELPIGEIKRLIRKRMFEGALLRFDELRSEMSAKSCFEGFQEQPIAFAPTYKFDRGTDEYDTSEKKRKPAWTDRILWRCRSSSSSSSSSSSEVRPVSYESAPEVLLSDHKPVSACFIVKIGSE